MLKEPISVEVTVAECAAEMKARPFRTFGTCCILSLIPSVFVSKLQFSSTPRRLTINKYGHVPQAGRIGWASKGV
jgi:hypothetical protein